MDSGARIGYVLGGMLGPTIVTAVWLLIARFVPALNRRPALSNGVAALLACFVAYVGLSVGEPMYSPVVAAAFILIFLWFKYRRESSDLTQSPAIRSTDRKNKCR
jgi:hypothetical protein